MRLRKKRDMFEMLLIDKDPIHAERLTSRLGRQRLLIDRVATVAEGQSTLRMPESPYDLVIVNVSDNSEAWVRTIADLQQAVRESRKAWPPLILCVSTRKRDPQFELQIERHGARYVLER